MIALNADLLMIGEFSLQFHDRRKYCKNIAQSIAILFISSLLLATLGRCGLMLGLL